MTIIKGTDGAEIEIKLLDDECVEVLIDKWPGTSTGPTASITLTSEQARAFVDALRDLFGWTDLS